MWINDYPYWIDIGAIALGMANQLGSASHAVIAVAVMGRGMIKILPIIIGIAVSYVVALIFGWTSLAGFEGAVVALPKFMFPKFEVNAMITFCSSRTRGYS